MKSRPECGSCFYSGKWIAFAEGSRFCVCRFWSSFNEGGLRIFFNLGKQTRGLTEPIGFSFMHIEVY